MLIFLDSNIVIYLIELPGHRGPQVQARIAAIRAAQDHMVVSDLTRLECRVGPIRQGDASTLAQYDAFFASSEVQVMGLTAAVCDRAAVIRARSRYGLADSLHLAAAVEAGCDVFLTNDARLSGFADLTIEVLP